MKNLGALNSQLKQQIQQERQEIENITRRELHSMSRHLSEHVKNELDLIAADTLQLQQSIQKDLKQISILVWLRPFIASVLIIPGLAAGGWSVTAIMEHKIQSKLQEIDQLTASIRKKETSLRTIKTWGLSLQADNNGHFIILPKGTRAKTGWTMTIDNYKHNAIRLEAE